MAEATHAPVSEAPASLDVLKRLKEAEIATKEQIDRARQDAEATLAKIRTEAAAAIQAARAEAEKAREAIVQGARGSAQAEADRIVAEGKAAADKLGRRQPKELDAMREKILDAVLGDFRRSSA